MNISLNNTNPNTVATPVSLPAATTQEVTQAVYNFFGYDAKLQYPAPDNNRLVTCLYRTKEGHIAARPNEGIFVPDWITEQVVTDNIGVLTDILVGYLQEQENLRVKESHKLHSKGFGDSFFTMELLLGYLEDKGAGSRLSGETIKEWYKDSGLEEAVTELYMEKTEQNVDKVTAIVSFIGKKLESLASPRTVWTQEEKDKLVPLLEVVADTSLGAKLLARIERMSEGESMLDAL